MVTEDERAAIVDEYHAVLRLFDLATRHEMDPLVVEDAGRVVDEVWGRMMRMEGLL